MVKAAMMMRQGGRAYAQGFKLRSTANASDSQRLSTEGSRLLSRTSNSARQENSSSNYTLSHCWRGDIAARDVKYECTFVGAVVVHQT